MKGLYDNFFYGRIPLFPLFSFFSYFQLNHIKNGLFCFTTNIWCHVTQYNVSQVIFNFFFYYFGNTQLESLYSEICDLY